MNTSKIIKFEDAFVKMDKVVAVSPICNEGPVYIFTVALEGRHELSFSRPKLKELEAVRDDFVKQWEHFNRK